MLHASLAPILFYGGKYLILFNASNWSMTARTACVQVIRTIQKISGKNVVGTLFNRNSESENKNVWKKNKHIYTGIWESYVIGINPVSTGMSDFYITNSET